MITVVDLVGKLPVHPTLRYKTRSLDLLDRVVIHHTAGPTSQTPDQIARFHVNSNGWPGIAYHYLIAADGTIYKCWPASTVSYCVEKGNTPSLCVCLIGNFTQAGPPAPQWAAAVSLSRMLLDAYDLTKLFGHKETPTSPPQSTACPGAKFDMNAFRFSVGATRE